MKLNKLKATSGESTSAPAASIPVSTPLPKVKAKKISSLVTWNRFWGGVFTLGVIIGIIYSIVNSIWVVTSGMVNASTSTVASMTGGRIVDILVSEGAMVKAGQPIMTLSNPIVKARFEAAKTELTQSRIVVGDPGVMGSTEYGLTASAKFKKTQARYEAALRNAQRAKKLLLLDAISRTKYEEAKTALAEIEADWTLAKFEWRRATGSDKYSKGSAGNEFSAEVSLAEASYSEAKAAMDELTLTAPLDGQMTWFTKSVGEVVEPWEVVARVIGQDRSRIDTFVRLSDLKDIGPGSEASIRFGRVGQSFAGVVSVVGPHVNLPSNEKFVGPERALSPNRINDLVTIVQVVITEKVPFPIEPGVTVNVWIKRK